MRDYPEDFDLSKVKGTENRAELLLLLLSKNGELEKHELPNGCDSSLNNPKIREISNTITTRYDAGIQNQQQIGMCVVEDNKKKILEQIDGDFGVIDSFNNKLTDPDYAGVISTRQGSNQGSMIVEKILIKNATKKGYLEAKEGDGIDISSRMETHRGTVQKDKSQTITTMGGENVGVVVLGNYSPSNHNASRIIDVGGGSSYCDGKSWNDNGNN